MRITVSSQLVIAIMFENPESGFEEKGGHWDYNGRVAMRITVQSHLIIAVMFGNPESGFKERCVKSVKGPLSVRTPGRGFVRIVKMKYNYCCVTQ
jgi:hypothetical protein